MGMFNKWVLRAAYGAVGLVVISRWTAPKPGPSRPVKRGNLR